MAPATQQSVFLKRGCQPVTVTVFCQQVENTMVKEAAFSWFPSFFQIQHSWMALLARRWSSSALELAALQPGWNFWEELSSQEGNPYCTVKPPLCPSTCTYKERWDLLQELGLWLGCLHSLDRKSRKRTWDLPLLLHTNLIFWKLQI